MVDMATARNLRSTRIPTRQHPLGGARDRMERASLLAQVAEQGLQASRGGPGIEAVQLECRKEPIDYKYRTVVEKLNGVRLIHN